VSFSVHWENKGAGRRNLDEMGFRGLDRYELFLSDVTQWVAQVFD
jgi:hypothetical protein